MLFCCLWCNVETSCHKHFVIISRHQQTLPLTTSDKCHNLPWSDGAMLITPSRYQRGHHTMNSFWQNLRTWRMDRHTDTATAWEHRLHLHSIMQQKNMRVIKYQWMHSGYIIIFHHIQVCGICTIYKIVLLTYLLGVWWALIVGVSCCLSAVFLWLHFAIIYEISLTRVTREIFLSLWENKTSHIQASAWTLLSILLKLISHHCWVYADVIELIIVCIAAVL